MKVEFKDPQKAFEKAISEGRLSADPNRPNFAGAYMYMGTRDGVDAFKNVCTRNYLPANHKN